MFSAQPSLLLSLAGVIRITWSKPKTCKTHSRARVRVMQKLYDTPEALCLENERTNLVYILTHAELTEEQRTNIQGRLAVVENDLLKIMAPDAPK